MAAPGKAPNRYATDFFPESDSGSTEKASAGLEDDLINPSTAFPRTAQRRSENDEEADFPGAPLIGQRRLITKIDMRVLPFLCLLYVMAFLDRVNIGNANIFGLSDDLDLKHHNRYNDVLTIFFLPYVLFEIPSNILLKRLKPHIWLSGCMFMFGVITVCQGLVCSYGGLLTTRFFLGLFESGMFPGCFYLIGMWYRRHEAQRRFTFFFCSTTLAGAFGGLLASAIGQMDGFHGYRGWRWIFILEGILTCLVAVLLYFCIPGFPEDAKWLTTDEREYIRARIAFDQGSCGSEKRLAFSDVISLFKDPKTIVGGCMYFGLIVPAYGFAYFSPAIIKEYGYGNTQTQLHSVAPWASAFVFAMIVAYASDKLRHRFIFTLLPISVAVTGFIMLLQEYKDTDTEYAALFLVTMGTYSAMPVIVCWFNMNLGGHYRRSIGSAWQISFGNIGAVVATYAFLLPDAPRYVRGFSLCLGFIAFSAVSCVVYFLLCSAENRRRDKLATNSSLTDHDRQRLGDLSPDYRYLL